MPPPTTIGVPPLPTATSLSPPRPTSTSIPYPAASLLYAQSRHVLQSTRGYRLAENATRVLKGGSQQTFVLNGDVSARAGEERLTLQRTDGNGKKQREEMIRAGGRAWIRSAAAHASWKQVKLSSLSRLFGPMRDPFVLDDAMPSNLETLGPDTFHGTSVWHLRWTEKSGSRLETVDELISRQGYLPYRTTRSIRDARTGAPSSDRVVRSLFGERVQIKSPR